MRNGSDIDQDGVQGKATRSWVMLVTICCASTLGLAAAVLPLLAQRIESPWPWAQTQRLLLFALPITLFAAVFYLTDQQRRATSMQRELLHRSQRAAERAQRQSTRLAALLNVSRIMGSEIRLQGVFDAVTQICREAFGCDQVSLMLVDSNAQELVVRSASGHKEVDKVIGSRQRLGDGVAGHVATYGKPVILGPGALDPGKFQAMRQQRPALAAAMVVPILVRDELVGVLNVASHAPDIAYDNEDLQALQVFAENVGACIRHAQQAEWMRQLIHRYGGASGAPAAESRPVTQPTRQA